MKLAIAAALLWSGAARAELQLLMFDEKFCQWCEAWTRDVGDVYDKTAEGKRAPLRRISIHDPLPEDVKLRMSARYTPTFVLLNEGVEVGRIEGYPGEDFFWGLLGQLLGKLPDGPVIAAKEPNA
jgi:hypothetical protein